MSFGSRLVSIVPWSVLCLLLLDGAAPPVAESQTAPPPAPGGQPTATVRPRMRQHFAQGAAIRDAVLLQADHQVCHGEFLVEQREQFPPGVRFGNRERGGNAKILQYGEWLGAADDRFDIADGGQKLLSVDMALDLLHE